MFGETEAGGYLLEQMTHLKQNEHRHSLILKMIYQIIW
jgi:type VI protein secretion system component VasF